MKNISKIDKNKKGVGINWDEVQSRLNSVQKSLESNLEIPAEKLKEILHSRAEAFSREPEKKDEDQNTIEILEFVLAYERYGVESSFIQEVYPMKTFTQLPCTPPFVLGIINARGRIISVLDIKKFFDLPEKGLTDLNKVIILHSAKMEFGILADAISGMRKIPLAKLQQELPTLTGIRADFLKGVTPDGIIILDGEKFLNDNKIIINDES